MGIPKVTVIVPVYNAARYLQDTLKSLRRQTLEAIEVICINDGSTDNSLELLRQFEACDSRITVIDQSNSGAGAARNAGLRAAKGEYLSFLDADDLYEPTMLERAYAAAKEYEADLVVYGADFYYEDSGTYRKEPWLDLRRLPARSPFDVFDIEGNPFRSTNGWTWDKLFRRSFVLDNRIEFQEQRTYNDMSFTFKALIYASRVAVVDQTLIHQRKNHGNSLSQTGAKSWWCVHDALLGLKEGVLERGKTEVLSSAFDNYALHMLHFNAQSLSRAPEFPKLYRAMRGEWFQDLGLCDQPSGYFNVEYDVQWFERVCSQELEDYLMEELAASDGRAGRLSQDNALLRKKLDERESELRALRKSKRYRLGTAVAVLPEHVGKVLKRVKRKTS